MDKPVNFDDGCGRKCAFAKAINDFSKEKGRKKWTVGLPKALNRLSRHFDRAIGRSYNGVWQRLFMEGHSVVPMLFMLVAIVFTVVGPLPLRLTGWGWGWGWLAFSGIFAAVAGYWAFVHFVLAKRADGPDLLAFQIPDLLTFQIVVLGALVAVFWLPASGNSEVMQAPYQNLFAPIMLILLALATSSNWVASVVMKGFPVTDRELFAELLKKSELFDPDIPPEPTPHRFFHGLINAPLYHPLHMLLLPALPLITIPPQHINLVGGLFLFAAWVLLTFAGMYERLNLMIRVVRNLFLIGGQLVVSLVIIGLAVARVFKIDYVTTLLDSASAEVILYYVFAAYTAFWLYEYWINRALSERMLPMLLPAGAPERMTWIEYTIDKKPDESVRAKAENRAIEVFSGGRFAVTGAYLDGDSGTTCARWAPYEKIELFERLTQSASPDTKYRANVAAAEIDKRTKLYFNIMNLLLFGIVFAGAYLLLRFIPQQAEAEGYRIEGAQAARQPVSLGELVFDQRRAGNKVIMLAASGGGTRAALYTASTLRGIAALGRLDDVVLVSGVSGGSAALAYFALHREELLKQLPGPCTAEMLEDIDEDIEIGKIPDADAWCVYIATMARPYIEDVLRGASQFDVAMSKTFGHLLDGSFMRNFGVAPEANNFNKITGLGMILSTTLSGHPANDSGWLDSLYRDRPVRKPPDSYSVSAGGRLIFTNLREVGSFPRPGALAHAQDEYLRYVIVGGERTTVTAAAALSANFPPLFPNGGIDVLGPGGSTQRYWVTDGGVAENRGIISLLYALLSMLDECKNRPEWKCQIAPPEIHVIVADASAVSIDYHRDRGAGAIFGASSKISSQLMLELITSAQQKYSGLKTHYLPMPAVLRMRGGLGTHWMMPRSVTLKDISEPYRKRAEEVSVKRLALMEMIANLHTPSLAQPPLKAENCQLLRPDKEKECKARVWLAADRHAGAWSDIVTALEVRTQTAQPGP